MNCGCDPECQITHIRCLGGLTEPDRPWSNKSRFGWWDRPLWALSLPLFAGAYNAYRARMVEHGPGAIAPASATFCNNSVAQFANLPCVLPRRACNSAPKTRLWPCREGFWHDACCEKGVVLESLV